MTELGTERRPWPGGGFVARVTEHDKKIMRLRAEAHAEWERLHGKPRVLPGFQERALALHFEYVRSRGSQDASSPQVEDEAD